MSNSLLSNITRQVMRSFLKPFTSNRVVTKTVDTRLFRGKFGPSTGSSYDIKRPHDYTTIRTPGGDISGETKDDIIAGKATANVQDFFTGALEFGVIEEAIELDQLDEIMAPEARRIITDLEVDFAKFMMKNSALVQGTPGTAVTDWQDVAKSEAFMSTIGVPMDMPHYYLINPFSQVVLSEQQHSTLNGPDGLVRTAWENAQISRDFGGLKALTSQALGSYTKPLTTDQAGTVNGAPDPTYITSKDTHTQAITVAGFTDSVTLPAGTVVEIPTRFLLSQSTREPALDGAGANIPWRGVLVADAVLTAGAGTFIVSSPAIFETTGTRDAAYNTVVAAIEDADVINIIPDTNAATTFQPNLFYHPQAFSITTVNIPKLFSTDTKFTTEDGFTIRVSAYSDGDANLQKIRWDLLPAYAALNPWFSGHGWKE